MAARSLLEELAKQLEAMLPFVVYSKPDSKEIRAWLQKTDQLNFTTDFEEEGFVFAPFDLDEGTVVFKRSDCQMIAETASFVQQQFPARPNYADPAAEKELYQEMVKRAVDEIEATNLSKVVLSRVVQVDTTRSNPIEIFQRLFLRYSNAFVYCWYHPKVGLWLGATPELLMTLKRNQLSTVSLAGTLSASDPNPWSDKERHEQQLVTDYIISELEALSQQVEADPVREIRAGHLRHLKSEVRALIQPENVRLKDLILRLHPTPAVCGFPKDLAREFIFKNENYQRRYYTGFLGEINALREVSRTSSKRNTENKAFKSLFKETELFVNLRCMNLDNGPANVYVGGGVVQNSQPEIEWSETVEKSNTMISVL